MIHVTTSGVGIRPIGMSNSCILLILMLNMNIVWSSLELTSIVYIELTDICVNGLLCGFVTCNINKNCKIRFV